MTSDVGQLPQERLTRVREAAYRIREYSLIQAEVQGQGYIGQALGISDVLAALYADQLEIRPEEPEWEERDRCLLSIGHYALAMYAALVEAKVLPQEELVSYAADDSRLPMSSMSTYTPGMEISGGSLGHGLGIGVGVALGLQRKTNTSHVYNILSDGELNEGSTWEAAMQAAHYRLSNLTAIVDFNALQADGPSQDMLRTEPVTEKFEAFGWKALSVDGNDIEQIILALEELRGQSGQPGVLVCYTKIGKGVPMLETKEKLHFMRVGESEWEQARTQLREGFES